MYGDAVNDPVKFCGGRTGREDRVLLETQVVFKENCERIFGKKKIKLYNGEVIEV